MPNHARDAPQPLRTNFGEIENLRFRNFGTGSEIWARPCPSLAIAAFRARSWAAPCDFCRIYPKLTVFEFQASGKRVRRTQGGPGPLPRCPLPTQHSLRHQKPPKPSKFIKKHKKHTKLPKITQKCPKTGFEVLSRQQNSVLVGLTSWAATNDY